MKGKIFIPVILFALTLSGCDIFDDANDTAQELSDLKKGKIFLSERGTVNYAENLSLVFKDYGRIQCVKTDSLASVIYSNDSIYTLNHLLRFYSVNPFEASSYGGFVGFCFMQHTWYAAIKLTSPQGLTQKTETIAGKECIVFSYTQQTENSTITVRYGGWNRILFTLEGASGSDGYGESLQAVSFSETANENDFVIPLDYTRTEN